MLEIVVPAGEGEVVGAGVAAGVAEGLLFEVPADGGAGFDVELGVGEPDVEPAAGGATAVLDGVVAELADVLDDIAAPPQPEIKAAPQARMKIPINPGRGKRISQF